MDLGMHEIDYQAQAHWHHFTFRLGALIGIDRSRRTVRVARYLDEEGREILRVTAFWTMNFPF
jgi:NADH dehydrogenase